MVLIIDGEIVQDNDPRAVARRSGGGAAAAAVSRGPRGPSAAAAAAASGPARAAAAAAAGGAGPLDQLAAMIGIQGQIVTVPRLHERIPPRDVPMVVAGLLGVATFIFGWRVLALMAVMHCASGFSETAPPPAQQPGQAGGRRQ